MFDFEISSFTDQNYLVPIACGTMCTLLVGLMIAINGISTMKTSSFVPSTDSHFTLLYRPEPLYYLKKEIQIENQSNFYLVLRDVCNKLFIFRLQQYKIANVQQWLETTVFPIFGTNVECYLMFENQTFSPERVAKELLLSREAL